MTRSGIAGLLLFLVVGCIAGALVVGVGIGPTVAAATHQLTISGTDFRPLDNDIVTRYAPGTGGGIWVGGSTQSTPIYLEAPVALPVGAQVTRVTYFYRSCQHSEHEVGDTLYFGAYNPGIGAFGAAIAEFAPPIVNPCAATHAVTKVLSTAATIHASQQWVLGDHVSSVWGASSYSPDAVGKLLVGARITYLK